jgi:hypothetical protein
MMKEFQPVLHLSKLNSSHASRDFQSINRQSNDYDNSNNNTTLRQEEEEKMRTVVSRKKERIMARPTSTKAKTIRQEKPKGLNLKGLLVHKILVLAVFNKYSCLDPSGKGDGRAGETANLIFQQKLLRKSNLQNPRKLEPVTTFTTQVQSNLGIR